MFRRFLVAGDALGGIDPNPTEPAFCAAGKFLGHELCHFLRPMSHMLAPPAFRNLGKSRVGNGWPSRYETNRGIARRSAGQEDTT